METTTRKAPSTKKAVKIPATEPRLVVDDEGWNVILGTPEMTIYVEVDDDES